MAKQLRINDDHTIARIHNNMRFKSDGKILTIELCTPDSKEPWFSKLWRIFRRGWEMWMIYPP